MNSTLEGGVATRKLQETISDEELEGIKYTYQVIERYTKKDYIYSLTKNLSGIRSNLNNLKKQKYLSEQAIDNILQTLISGLDIYDDEEKLIRVMVALTLTGKNPKWALDVFVSVMMGFFDEAPNLSDLADFLSEQGLVKDPITADALRIRIDRLDIGKTMAFLHWFNKLGTLKKLHNWERKDEVLEFLKSELFA